MVTTRAAVIRQFGPPSVLSVEAQEIAPPGEGEALIRHTAIGFNFIDVYQRKGIYSLPLPTGLGLEAAGIVEDTGPGVTTVKRGDRVAYMNAGVGAYSTHRNVAAEKLVLLPDTISDDVAATVLFKGMTAQYLLRKTHAVKAGELLLVHSAAGGVGQILTRWATALGASVIGTTGSPHKQAAIRAAGAVAVVDLTDPDWPEAFLKASGGRKARVVYDAVGKDTLLRSLDCAETFGLVVSYGAASGPAPAIDPDMLGKKGCLFLTRPSIFPHNSTPEMLRANAADLFDAISKGHVCVDIGERFALEQIAQAHIAAEKRSVSGAILIIP